MEKAEQSERLEAAVAGAPGRISVAVADLGTGAALVHGAEGHAFVSASVAKLGILTALLLRTQDRGGSLGAEQRALAATMIQDSDNDAAGALYTGIGRREGLDEANDRLGLTATRGGEDRFWGLTTTTAADQLTLLRRVFTADSPLGPDAREYVRELLRGVAADQRWGVGAAATGDDFQLKNGWLPRSDSGLWVINSTGRVARNGHHLLISVLSDGNTTMDQGVALVESVAVAAADAVGQRR